MTSDLGDSNNRVRPQEVDPRPHTSYQLGRSLDHEDSMRVAWMTRSSVTRVKSHWKKYGPKGSRSRGKTACMAREQLRHSQDRWPQRLGAQVGTQVVIPSEVAL